MLKRNQRGSQGQRGSGLTEFALLLPAFLLLTFGLIDVGRGVWIYNTLSHAVREGSRYAMVRGATHPYPASVGEIREVVRNRAPGLDRQKMIVSTWWDPDKNPGSAVHVQVRYELKLLTPLITSETIQLRSTSRMVISR